MRRFMRWVFVIWTGLVIADIIWALSLIDQIAVDMGINLKAFGPEFERGFYLGAVQTIILLRFAIWAAVSIVLLLLSLSFPAQPKQARVEPPSPDYVPFDQVQTEDVVREFERNTATLPNDAEVRAILRGYRHA